MDKEFFLENRSGHKAACEEWTHGLPAKIWSEAGALCIEYEDGQYWHYKTTANKLEWW